MADPTCRVPDCGRSPVIADGLCSRCYQRRYKHGSEFWTPPTKQADLTCAAPDCDLPAVAKGCCKGHSEKARRHGGVLPESVAKPDTCTASDECDKLPYCRGMCTTHYNRWLQHDAPQWEPPRQADECREDDCTDPPVAKGLCSRHYQSAKKAKRRAENPPELAPLREVDTPCRIDDCTDKVGKHGRDGLCPRHYRKQKTQGDAVAPDLPKGPPKGAPRPAGAGRPAAPPEQRFWSKVDMRGPDECWPWTGKPSFYGYGTLTVRQGVIVKAHRMAYELAHGSIPDGMTIEHLCHTWALDTCAGGTTCPHRMCCNPAHLATETRGDNQLAGHSQAAINKAKECCPWGHPYDEENTRHSGGRRYCRKCARDRGVANRRGMTLEQLYVLEPERIAYP